MMQLSAKEALGKTLSVDEIELKKLVENLVEGECREKQGGRNQRETEKHRENRQKRRWKQRQTRETEKRVERYSVVWVVDGLYVKVDTCVCCLYTKICIYI